MFEILIRPTGDPGPGKPFYCEDWQCPMQRQCRHHFGRSYAYAAMIQWEDGKDKTPAFTPDRFQYADRCDRFERDEPREWLKGWCEPPLQGGEQKTWCCIGCEAPECPRRGKVIPFKRC